MRRLSGPFASCAQVFVAPTMERLEGVQGSEYPAVPGVDGPRAGNDRCPESLRHMKHEAPGTDAVLML